MNRNNIWIHLTIALALILMAAFAGGVRKLYRDSKRTSTLSSQPQKDREREPDGESVTDEDAQRTEVLVRGSRRPGRDRRRRWQGR